MSTNDLSFDSICKDTVARTLEKYGYHLTGAYSIPRCYSLEYAADGRALFVGTDGGVVHAELLLDQTDRPYRIDLSLAVWYRSDRPRPIANESAFDQLTRLAEQLEIKCSDLLAGEVSVMDDRFCFQFQTSSQLDDHRKILIGEQ